LTCLFHMHFSLFHGLLKSSIDTFCWNMLRFWSHLSYDQNLRNSQWNLPPLGSDPWLIRSESGTWRCFFRIRISCHHWDILKWSESDLLLEAAEWYRDQMLDSESSFSLDCRGWELCMPCGMSPEKSQPFIASMSLVFSTSYSALQIELLICGAVSDRKFFNRPSECIGKLRHFWANIA